MAAMKDWQIAVMVVICVVFVALALLLIFLIYRYWNGADTAATTNRRCYGYCCGSEQDTDADEGGKQRKEARFYYPGCRPNPDILYFLDFNQRLCAINIKKEKLKTGAALQRAVAREAGVSERVDTLSLAATYASSGAAGQDGNNGSHPCPGAGGNVGAAYLIGDATLELDLDRLIAGDAQLGQRMRQTAERPLLLHRLVEIELDGDHHVHGSHNGAFAASPSLSNPFGAALSRSANTTTVDLSLLRQQQEQVDRWEQQPDRNMYSSHSRIKNDEQRGESSGARSSVPSHVAGIFHAPSTQTPLPPVTSVPSPLIFPSRTSHITTATPVFIMAAHYFICLRSSAESDGHSSSAGPPQPPLVSPVLVDEDTTALLEAAMCGEAGSRHVHPFRGPFAGSTFLVNPANGTATLRPSPSLLTSLLASQPHLYYSMADRGELLVVRRKADDIRFCCDTTGNAQWRRFTSPIFLPPGKWCLRAKVSSADGAFTDTCAKVFSVSVAME